MSGRLRELKPKNGSALSLLAFPAPYRAWITISNDPDHTTIERWQELHKFIWEELNLPLSDALFIVSNNENLPSQVSLSSHPEIAGAHLYDGLHSWGDYMHSRQKNFERADAIRNIEILKQHNIHPLVWADHSSHRANLTHNSNLGTKPTTKDASGHVYENFLYTLDLVEETGIRYIWDGDAVSFIGQDYEIPRAKWYLDKMSATRALLYTSAHTVLSPVLKKFPLRRFSHGTVNNSQYFRNTFADGRTLYCFRRYGSWKLADIDGLAKVISKTNIDKLIERTGTSIVYTHLGKRVAEREQDTAHIPEETKKSLRYLKEKYGAGELMLSPVSALLDYLVLRDSTRIQGDTVAFNPDGIRFQTLTAKMLENFTFGIRTAAPARLKVTVAGTAANFTLEKIQGDYCNIRIADE